MMTKIKIINNLNDYKYLDYENILINEGDYKLGEYCLFFSYLYNNTNYQRQILKINNDLNLRIIKNNNDIGSGIINISKLKPQIDNDLIINLAGISVYQGNANFYIISNQLNIKIETEIYSFNLINGNYKINENTTKHLDITVTNQRQRDEYDKNYIYNMEILENVKLDIDSKYYLGIGKNHQSNYNVQNKIICNSYKTTFNNKGIINGTVCIGCTSYVYDDRYVYVDSQYNQKNLSETDGYDTKYISNISYFYEIEVEYDKEKINSGAVFIGCNFLRYKDFKESYLTLDNPELTIKKCSVKGININGAVFVGCNCQESTFYSSDIGFSFVNGGTRNNNQTYLNKNIREENNTFTVEDIICNSYNNLIFEWGYLRCSRINVEKITNKNIKCSEFNQLTGRNYNDSLHVFAKEIKNENINATNQINTFSGIGEIQKLNTDKTGEDNYVKYECQNLFSKNIYLPNNMENVFNVKLLYSDANATPNKEIQNWYINSNLKFKENPEFTLRKQRYNFIFSENINPNKPIFDKKLILKIPYYDIFYNNGESNPSITLQINSNDHSTITENLLNCVDIQINLFSTKDPRNIPKILKCLFVLYLMTENDREFLNLLAILIIHFYRMYKKIYTGVDHRINIILLYIWNEVDDIFNSLKPYYNASVNFSNNNLISNSQNYYQSFYLIK